MLWPHALLLVFVAQAEAPRFEKYPVTERFQGHPAPPILATPEQRNFKTRIRQGVLKVDSDKTALNFAGHYIVIVWGCGSDCAMMATVDALTGTIIEPSLARRGSLQVPLDIWGPMEIDFKPDSRLLILRDACREGRQACGTYGFEMKEGQFQIVFFKPGPQSKI